MEPEVERWRTTDAGNLTRYRVLGATRLTIRDGFAMTVKSGIMVAGLLVIQGVLIVSKKT